jgi:subtilase family serine protease
LHTQKLRNQAQLAKKSIQLEPNFLFKKHQYLSWNESLVKLTVESKTFEVVFLFVILLVVCLPDSAFAASLQHKHDRVAQTFFHAYNKLGSHTNSHQNASSLATLSPTGLSPSQIRKAYNLPSTGGFGTIAIIDAYDCPTVQNDFVAFSRQYGLPTTNLEIHKMTPNIAVDATWALEISLDVQWAHAIAPNATILLVEAKSNSLSDLLDAVNYATSRPDVVAVSMSWGTSEFLGENTYDSYFNSPNGIVFFASSGDSGAGVIYPSASPNVVAVGGTRLTFNPNGTLASEIGWSGSGGGVSAYETEPQYQLGYNLQGVNGKRAVPDVSYNADPYSGFSVYHTTAYQGQVGWFQLGGTSAGAPQWAAIHSLGLSVSSNNLYQNAKWSGSTYFRDITSGSNGAYSAASGYDFVTGLGSPVTWNYTTGIGSDFSISTSPSPLTTQNGSLIRSTVTVSSINGFSGRISLSVNSPSGWDASLSTSSIVVPLGGSNQSVLSVAPSNVANAGVYNVTITGSSGSLNHNAPLTVNILLPTTSTLTGFNVMSGGSGYTTPAVILMGGGGTGAKATARVSNGVIFDVVLTSPGIGYTSAPSISFRDPSPRAKGAAALAVMDTLAP